MPRRPRWLLLASLLSVGCGASPEALEGDAGVLPISGDDVYSVDAGSRDAGAFPVDRGAVDVARDSTLMVVDASSDGGVAVLDAGIVIADATDPVDLDAGATDVGAADDSPVDAGPMDSGPRDTGPMDTGPRDSGPRDTGPRDTGPVDTGPRDTGPMDTGPRDTGPMDTGPRDTGPMDTGPRDTGPVDTGPRDTGPRDTGPHDTGPVDTGPRDTGPVDTGMGSPVDDPVAYSGTFTVRTGRFTRNLSVAGQSRQVVLNVPTSAPASPALIVLFHGTNGDGSVAMTESNAVPLSNAEGVIVAAPTSRWIGHGDFDHATEETYWETETDPDPNHNPDVLLVRAILVEARRVYNVDPDRVYLMGHSSGGFFAQFAATLLRDRVAAFAENSSGLVRCARRASCSFQGSGTTCATLATRSGWCGCSGAELPIAVATDGRMPPGYLSHGTADPLVSVYYTCTLESRLRAVGADVSTELFNGEGHAVPSNWAQRVWPFLSAHTLSGR